MPSTRLLAKLDPDRYPNMSLTFVAILGYLLNEPWTQPIILEITRVDDVMLAMSEGQWLPNFLGEVSDLRAHLRRLGMAASLTPEEWTEYRQMVETRLGLRL
jgi:hypothetical protein